MSPTYAIMRFKKYKGPEIGRIEAHDERTKETYASNPDVDTSLIPRKYIEDQLGGCYNVDAIMNDGCPTEGGIRNVG